MLNYEANEFNQKFEVGYNFIYQRSPVLRGGIPVQTISEAKNSDGKVVVQINNPDNSWVPINTLAPAGGRKNNQK